MALMRAAANNSETPVNFYQTMRRCNQKNSKLHPELIIFTLVIASAFTFLQILFKIYNPDTSDQDKLYR
jgi:hypothetical protein